ncbi:orotidine-5'-phosphate decarboxylase [Galactobacter caseinivorans]|uniref:orotidine-5'-phosphate decarboxylase n=1 Tax=Galactobacter caseinivorans TaxID=2676123 RepID=UPI001F1E0B7E|nr:orotidine-5'-phosphate decarboxylase [Galactobacter caseinivorans]
MTPVPFGARLAQAISTHGHLCVGIDPHPGLLQAWGLPDDAEGLRRFSSVLLGAAEGRAAAIKPQVALYERHGSRGLAVLEELLEQAREAGVLSVADAKRGDIGSTMAGYAQAWLGEDSPLRADSVTLSPYLGVGALMPALELAEQTGRGVWVLGLTSNPEGQRVQHAGGPDSAAGRVVADVAAWNREHGDVPLGSVGLVVGATTGSAAKDLGIDLGAGRPPLLTPGYGAQGATAADLRRDFAGVWDQVLVPASRSLAHNGPSGVVQCVVEAARDLAA